MKTIVKFFSINDGQQKQLVNRDFLFMQEFPRVEAILSEFLSEGYTLQSCLQKVTPGTNQPGAYNFYLGGWDIILTKQMEEDEEDRSDELMQRAIAKVQLQEEELNDEDDDGWQYSEEDLIEECNLDDEIENLFGEENSDRENGN